MNREGEMDIGRGQYGVQEDYPMVGEDKRGPGFPSVEQAKKCFLPLAIPCPLCKTPPEALSWVYLVIPRWACKNTAEHKGWVTVCDQCKVQINFFVEKE
jgi:hypothetical protein